MCLVEAFVVRSLLFVFIVLAKVTEKEWQKEVDNAHNLSANRQKIAQ